MSVVALQPQRKLPSWIDGFYTYTEKTDSPALFRKWSAIFAIAAALERKIYLKTTKGLLYPNIYAVIVGPPGAGKTVSAAIASDMLRKLEAHHIAPSSVTRASLIDALSAADRNYMLPKAAGIEHFHSLAIISEELGVLLPGYDNDFMNILTSLYDNRRYSETRRTNKLSIDMPNPQLNLIAATTPSFLNNLIPEGAWEQGFMSRVMMIYSGASAPGDLFAEVASDIPLGKILIEDLQAIGRLTGEIKFDPEAAAIFIQWHKTSVDGGPPIPDHPKLMHYAKRRSAHLLKLCMIVSCARSSDLIITIEDYVEALDLLVEAETYMPDIFKAMKTGGDSVVMDETWHHVYKLYMKENKPIAEGRVVAFLAERTPAHNVARVLEVMVRIGIFKLQMVDYIGNAYTPRSRKD